MTCGPIWLLSLASCALGHIMPVQRGREAGRASGGGNREKLAFLVAVAEVLPARVAWSCGGEPAEELAAVGGPYEAFMDDRVAFIVDLESPVVHQPGPGAFHDPPSG